MGNPIDGVKVWLLKVAVKKVLKRAAPWLVATIAMFAVKASQKAAMCGIAISVDEAALAASVASGLALVQNWVKVKYGLDWL